MVEVAAVAAVDVMVVVAAVATAVVVAVVVDVEVRIVVLDTKAASARALADRTSSRHEDTHRGNKFRKIENSK
jgi:hypothetical protein